MKSGFISKRAKSGATSYHHLTQTGRNPERASKKATVNGGFFPCRVPVKQCSRKIVFGLFPEDNIVGTALPQGKRGDQGEAGFLL